MKRDLQEPMIEVRQGLFLDLVERAFGGAGPLVAALAEDAPPSIRLDDLPTIGAEHPGGGIYAGITLHQGAPMALVLIGTAPDRMNWDAAKAFAKDAGGELPNRHDALALYENRKALGLPEEGWDWTSEPLPSDSDCAYVQNFTSGSQYWSHVGGKTRARAVRRVPIR